MNHKRAGVGPIPESAVKFRCTQGLGACPILWEATLIQYSRLQVHFDGHFDVHLLSTVVSVYFVLEMLSFRYVSDFRHVHFVSTLCSLCVHFASTLASPLCARFLLTCCTLWTFIWQR